MHRREFLAASGAGTATLLSSTIAAFLGRNVGIGTASGESDTATPIPPRAPTLDGRVVDVDGTTVTVEVAAKRAIDAVRVVAVRRGYPDGEEHSEARSDPLGLTGPGDTTTVDLDVPAPAYRSGRWFYEVFVVRTGRQPAFLCESAPRRWRQRPEYGTTSADRVSDEHGDVSREHLDRELVGNDYRLRYRWRGSDDRRWRVDYRLRRSVHEASVARQRGYVHTFEESQSNPYARDLANVVARQARLQTDDGTGGTDAAADTDSNGSVNGDETRNGGADAGAAPLTRGERFDRLVRFVQGLGYARDAATTGRYDYNRTVEETLVAGVGDCKDKTHLLAGLLSAPPLSCETAMLFQPAHVILGVAADDVPERFADRETVDLGGTAFLPVDGSIRFPIGDYPDRPITAAFANGTWIHYDADAIVRGLDRNVRDWIEQTQAP
jgi:hypothetical protein